MSISILGRLIDSGQNDLAPEVAQAILQIHFTEADQRRVAELGEKSNQGTLTPAEAEEYDAYISAGELLSLWQSKARICLKRHSSAA